MTSKRRSVRVALRSPLLLAALGGVCWSGCGDGAGTATSAGGSSGSVAVNTNGGSDSQLGGASSSAGMASNAGVGGSGTGGGGAGGQVSVAGGAAGSGSAMGGDGGSSSEQVRGSPGCGSTQPLESGRITVDIGGTARQYVLDVPSSYDADHPYRLVFAWHWVGVTADAVVGGEPGEYGGLGPYYGLKALANETAIFVAPEGIDFGWLNTDDRDIAFARGMLEQLNAGLCIDQDRIFSTGFSYGAMMSVAVGCEMGDVFRAIAPMSGSRESGCNDLKSDALAFWGAHGNADVDILPEEGRIARDIFVARNHCEEGTAAAEPSPCVEFEGCDTGYPVHWCEFNGAHTQWSDAPQPLWNFFTGF